MKTKEQAAKILLDAGWTLEEVTSVLTKQNPLWIQPYPPVYWWQTGTGTGNSITLDFESEKS